MEFMGIDVSIKNKPVFEPEFIPSYKFIEGYLKGAKVPYAFAWERRDGNIVKFDTRIYGTPEFLQHDLFYLKLVAHLAFISWGGYRLYLCGDPLVSERLKESLIEDIKNKVGIAWMLGMAEEKGEFVLLDYHQCPEKEVSQPIGRHLDGCRIGFDAGASDRKVSAVIDGKVVYSEEVIWYAKFRNDIDYIYNEILTAFKTAAAKMPRVDAIGVSTAGMIVNNLQYAASFYRLIDPEVVKEKGRDIYQRAAKAIGEDIPITLCNDGDIAALAGSMMVNRNKMWGVAIGTSVGTGYIDGLGYLTSRACEFSTSKLSLNPKAALNESKQLRGVGESYFSQDCVNRLAAEAGIELDENLYPAEKLLIVQQHMRDDDPRAIAIYKHIGCCFAHSVPLVKLFFDAENVCLLGRVVSEKGGDLILSECRRILAEEYPEVAATTAIWLPDENERRVAQSIAAASLPEISR